MLFRSVYESGYVKVQHSGGYVAKFTVTWDAPNDTGVFVAQSWSSGNKTAGFSYTVGLDGDVRNVRVQAWAATGLVWDPWGEIFNDVQGGPINRTYIAKGTTLHRSWSYEDPAKAVDA